MEPLMAQKNSISTNGAVLLMYSKFNASMAQHLSHETNVNHFAIIRFTHPQVMSVVTR